jgi:hypothetical protein
MDYRNKLSDCLKDGTFLDLLSNCHLFNEDCVRYSQPLSYLEPNVVSSWPLAMVFSTNTLAPTVKNVRSKIETSVVLKVFKTLRGPDKKRRRAESSPRVGFCYDRFSSSAVTLLCFVACSLLIALFYEAVYRVRLHMQVCLFHYIGFL